MRNFNDANELDDCTPLTADEAEERAADLEDFHSWQRKKPDNVEETE